MNRYFVQPGTGQVFERAPGKNYIIGLDLGQANDWTALTLLDCVSTFSENGWVTSHLDEPRYDVVQIQRPPQRTPYTEQVAWVRDVVRDLTSMAPEPEIDLVLDYTGCGRPVADMFLAADLPCRVVLVTITGGDSVTKGQSSDEFRVPKRDLSSAVRVLMEADRLHFTDQLPLSDVLERELAAFRVKISLSGHDSYAASEDWRSGGSKSHDDLVLSAALACWWGENRGSGWTAGLMAGFAAWAVDMGVG